MGYVTSDVNTVSYLFLENTQSDHQFNSFGIKPNASSESLRKIKSVRQRHSQAESEERKVLPPLEQNQQNQLTDEGYQPRSENTR